MKERYPCFELEIEQDALKLTKLRGLHYGSDSWRRGGGASTKHGASIREGRLIQTLHLRGGVY